MIKRNFKNRVTASNDFFIEGSSISYNVKYVQDDNKTGILSRYFRVKERNTIEGIKNLINRLYKAYGIEVFKFLPYEHGEIEIVFSQDDHVIGCIYLNDGVIIESMDIGLYLKEK